MIVVLIALGILGLAVAIVVGTGMRESRVDRNIAETADWVETEATIQSAVVERIDKYTSYPSFAFSYSVKGEYFSGRFFLRADLDQSDDLVKTLPGQKFPVQYDPANPSAWFMAEANIAGFEIIQKMGSDYPADAGPYRSDGGEPIDLNLNR